MLEILESAYGEQIIENFPLINSKDVLAELMDVHIRHGYVQLTQSTRDNASKDIRITLASCPPEQKERIRTLIKMLRLLHCC